MKESCRRKGLAKAELSAELSSCLQIPFSQQLPYLLAWHLLFLKCEFYLFVLKVRILPIFIVHIQPSVSLSYIRASVLKITP